MKLVKRTRPSRPKLQKGQTADGNEYYYSKKPSQRRTDYVVEDGKIAAKREKSVVASKKG